MSEHEDEVCSTLGYCAIAVEMSVKANVPLMSLDVRIAACSYLVLVQYNLLVHRSTAKRLDIVKLNRKLRDSLRVWHVAGAKIGSSGVCVNIQNQTLTAHYGDVTFSKQSVVGTTPLHKRDDRRSLVSNNSVVLNILFAAKYS